MTEYLIQSLNPAVPEDYRPKFTVNTAVADVVLSDSGLAAKNGLLRNGSGNFLFQPNDNFILVSAGLVLPHGFVGANLPVLFNLIVETSAGVNISTMSRTLPAENVEWEIGDEFPHASSGNKVRYRAVFAGLDASVVPRVSMANVPALLNTLELRAWVFMKVRHSIALTSV